MSLEDHSDLVVQIARLIDIASRDYQSFQLAAQQADTDGLPLVAGVLRSIAESQAGKAHGLLNFVRANSNDPTNGGISGFLQSAISRAGESEKVSAAVLTQAADLLDARQAQDLEAVVSLTATNRQRLERLAAGIAAK